MPKIIANLALYDLKEISKKIGLGVVTLRSYIKQGKLTARKVGNSYLVSEDSLKTFFNSAA